MKSNAIAVRGFGRVQESESTEESKGVLMMKFGVDQDEKLVN